MKYSILALSFVLLLVSCGIAGKNLNGFTNYMLPIRDETSTKLRAFDEGVYVSIEKIDQNIGRRNALIFSKNGKCYLKSVDANFWNDKDFWENQTKFYKDSTNYSFLSEYLIRNDTLILQYFVRRGDAFYSNHVVEEKYRILNENELLNYEYTVYKAFLFDEPQITKQLNDTLRFYEVKNVDLKPRAWYLEKQWYRSNLYESRKLN